MAFYKKRKVTPFKDNWKLFPVLLQTTIVTSYILRIKKVQEMDRWNHSGALGSIQELNVIEKKGLDRQSEKNHKRKCFPPPATGY